MTLLITNKLFSLRGSSAVEDEKAPKDMQNAAAAPVRAQRRRLFYSFCFIYILCYCTI